MSMNVAAVRRLTKNPQPLVLPVQRLTLRCKCGWYMRDVLASESTRLYDAHLTGARHTGRNHKRGPQQATRDRHEGRSWAK